MDRIVADAELAGACRSLSESGYCLIKNVLAADRAEALRERIVSQARAQRTNGGEFAFSAEAFVRRGQPVDSPARQPLSNYTLGLRSEVKAKLSDELVGLLGFAPWEGYGMTDDPDASVARSGDESVGKLHGP